MHQGKKEPKEQLLWEVEAIAYGHQTTAFWKQVVARGRNSLPLPECCFSLVCKDRTLDFAAESPEGAQVWKDAFKQLIDEIRLEKKGLELPGPSEDDFSPTLTRTESKEVKRDTMDLKLGKYAILIAQFQFCLKKGK